MGKTLLWGAGSKALIVWEFLRSKGFEEHSVVFNPDSTSQRNARLATSAKFIEGFWELAGCWSEISRFVVCIGSEHGFARTMTSRALANLGVEPVSIIQDHTYLDHSSSLGVGNMVMTGAVIRPYVAIGDYCIVNTGAIIDHESQLGDGVHVMGGGVLAGRVRVGNFATIGANATVLPDLEVGENAFVGAGSTVTKSVPPGVVVAGSPARVIRYREPSTWMEDALKLLVERLEKSEKGSTK